MALGLANLYRDDSHMLCVLERKGNQTHNKLKADANMQTLGGGWGVPCALGLQVEGLTMEPLSVPHCPHQVQKDSTVTLAVLFDQ